MLIKLLPLLLLAALPTHQYILELEVAGRKKQCISEVFKKDEPISLRGTVISADTSEFSMYLTIETLGHKLLAHKKYESSSTSTVLTFNNDADQQLNLCVDNFEAYTIVIEVHLRYGIHLGDSDLAPTKNVSFFGILFGDLYMGMYWI